MAFYKAHDFKVSNGQFNDVLGNQSIYNIQGATLESALSTARMIDSTVQHVQNSREQLQVLGASINTLLSTLDREYRAGQILESNTSLALQNLNMCVHHIKVMNLERSSS